MGLTFLVALVPTFLHFHFGVAQHLLLRWHWLFATEEFHDKSHLQIEHLRCAHVKRQSNERHRWSIDVHTMLVQWLHIIVVHGNATVDAQKRECVFVTFEFFVDRKFDYSSIVAIVSIASHTRAKENYGVVLVGAIGKFGASFCQPLDIGFLVNVQWKHGFRLWIVVMAQGDSFSFFRHLVCQVHATWSGSNHQHLFAFNIKKNRLYFAQERSKCVITHETSTIGS